MLQIVGLCKSYDAQTVLAPIDFCLGAGCCLGITGENGSGKSTLLRLLAQVEKPDRGDIRFRGNSILGNREFMRRHVGYVPQGQELMEELTVRSQLKLWQSACGLSGPLPEDILELLGLRPLLKKSIRSLSGGMRRRVSIAMALLNKPDILIMDEATVGLDKDYSQKLMTWLEDYLRKGGRILWCSHHQEELDRLCGSCLRLQDGHLI